MRATPLLLVCLLSVTRCTLPEEAHPPVISDIPPAAPVFLASPPDQLGIVLTPSSTIAAPDYSCSVKLDRLNTQIRLARHQGELRAAKQAEPFDVLPVHQAAPLKPAMLIRTAQQASVIPPTTRCYFGASNVCRYLWTPNKLYPVYVSPTAKTKITLPPGETLLGELPLNEKTWDAGKVKVRAEHLVQDHILIRPITLETPSIDLSLLTESGHSFDIQLIVAPVGMFAVTWEVSPIIQAPQEEETPIFARPVR